MFAALLGIIACIAGYFTNPARLFQSYTVAFAFTSLIGLGAFFFVMVQFLTGSAWSVTMRRIMENIMITLPVGLLLFIPVAMGLNEIYPWTNQQAVAADAVLKAKSSYLTPNWFMARTFIYFFLWSLWAGSIYRQSTKQDTERSVRQMHIASRWSAPGLFLAIAVGTLASYDWLMSLEPKWYSTIFGLVMLSGGGSCRSSRWSRWCAWRSAAPGFSRTPSPRSITTTWASGCSAMTSFYTYVAFSQYFLIWYSNLPEETIWYRHRMVGSWLPISLAMPFLRFLDSVFHTAVPPRQAQPESDRLHGGVEPGGRVYRPVLDRDADLLQDRAPAALAGSGDPGDHGQHLRPGFLEPFPQT